MPYLQHFGLREPPFALTPDPAYFFACRSSREALNTVLVALSSGAGFVKITGEVGSGKTSLCRRLAAALNRSHWFAPYIGNPGFERRSMLLAIADAVSAPAVDPAADTHYLLKGIAQSLLRQAREGKHVALCIDESQTMSLDTLEGLRLLTNLETEKRKLLQVILFGQPELDENLSAKEVRPLRQRISFQHDLSGLAEEEVGAYLAHRLAVAGYVGPPLFGASSHARIYRASRGAPRLVNILADKALMAAFGEGAKQVERRHLIAAIADTPAAAPGSWWRSLISRPSRAAPT